MKTLYILIAMSLMFSVTTTGQQLEGIDEIAPFNEGFAAVRKGEQWGFIDKNGDLVIDFRNDLHWKKDADGSESDVNGVRYPMFNEQMCMITKKVEDGIPLYGFIDTSGKTVVEPKFLNVYPFKDGHTTGVLFEKTLRGKNEFKLNIYDFKFFDVLLNASGSIEEYFEPRQGIQMTTRRYKLPFIGAKMLSDDLVAVWVKGKGWEIRNLDSAENSEDETKG